MICEERYTDIVLVTEYFTAKSIEITLIEIIVLREARFGLFLGFSVLQVSLVKRNVNSVCQLRVRNFCTDVLYPFLAKNDL